MKIKILITIIFAMIYLGCNSSPKDKLTGDWEIVLYESYDGKKYDFTEVGITPTQWNLHEDGTCFIKVIRNNQNLSDNFEWSAVKESNDKYILIFWSNNDEEFKHFITFIDNDKFTEIIGTSNDGGIITYKRTK